MALTPCTECGGMIAHDAEFCPHCGHPTENRKFYKVRTGSPGTHPLGSFLHVAAVIVGIAGLILAIVGANQTEAGYYSSRTVFNWSIFLTSLANTAEAVFVLWCLGSVVNLIQGTYDMIGGTHLTRDAAATLSSVGKVVSSTSGPNSSNNVPRNPNWIPSELEGYAICPKCGKQTKIETLRKTHICPGCSHKY